MYRIPEAVRVLARFQTYKHHATRNGFEFGCMNVQHVCEAAERAETGRLEWVVVTLETRSEERVRACKIDGNRKLKVHL